MSAAEQVHVPEEGAFDGTRPVARNLAERLGGTLNVQSEPGKGSAFELRIPQKHPEARELSALRERGQRVAPEHQPVLVVEDDRQTLFLYEKYLRTGRQEGGRV